ncbi:MAG: TIM barrel protein [Phycisphaeraceae bacterium]|nr:MAG: TIM barrel protein [Phycisphaeraceae bacterium]
MSGVLGVCSWSLRPDSPADLVDKIDATGCRAVQLALDPIRRGEWNESETFDRLASAGVAIRSGMMAMEGEDYSTIDAIARTGGVRPDATWPINLAAANELAEIAARNGIGLVTFHAGFLPHDEGNPERTRMIERLRELASVFSNAGVRIGLETGQEDAETLLGVLDELGGRGVGVNFDPANMLLYGSGEPIRALERLAAVVVQLHIKDATRSDAPGAWGAEVPVGTGQVDWESFFDIVCGSLTHADLMIEREAGEHRVDDITTARERVKMHLRERSPA